MKSFKRSWEIAEGTWRESVVVIDLVRKMMMTPTICIVMTEMIQKKEGNLV